MVSHGSWRCWPSAGGRVDRWGSACRRRCPRPSSPGPSAIPSSAPGTATVPLRAYGGRRAAQQSARSSGRTPSRGAGSPDPSAARDRPRGRPDRPRRPRGRWWVADPERRPPAVALADECAPSLGATTRHVRLSLPPAGVGTTRARLRPRRRGTFLRTRATFRETGPLGLVTRQVPPEVLGTLQVHSLPFSGGLRVLNAAGHAGGDAGPLERFPPHGAVAGTGNGGRTNQGRLRPTVPRRRRPSAGLGHRPPMHR